MERNIPELEFATINILDLSDLGLAPGQMMRFFFEETPWKTDDAAWFKKHHNRAHRLRKPFEGEAATLSLTGEAEAVPEGHDLLVVVRQVCPGRRVRFSFWRNLKAAIPDTEAEIHALFDLVAAGLPGSEIGREEVDRAAKKYAAADFRGPIG